MNACWQWAQKGGASSSFKIELIVVSIGAYLGDIIISRYLYRRSYSLSWLERSIHIREVPGSSPGTTTDNFVKKRKIVQITAGDTIASFLQPHQLTRS